MFVSPLHFGVFVGVISTLAVEFIAVIVIAVCMNLKSRKGKGK